MDKINSLPKATWGRGLALRFSGYGLAQTKIVQALEMIIRQTGVAGTVVLPGEPLIGEDGKPLVD